MSIKRAIVIAALGLIIAATVFAAMNNAHKHIAGDTPKEPFIATFSGDTPKEPFIAFSGDTPKQPFSTTSGDLPKESYG